MKLFTVAKPEGTTNSEFDAYVGLLEQMGVDVSKTARIPELNTPNRWLYAWTGREQAERFLFELRSLTNDDSWYLREFEGDTSIGPLAPLKILRSIRGEEFQFNLDRTSQDRVLRAFPNARLTPRQSVKLTVPHIVAADFEELHGPLWDDSARLLTGLSDDQIRHLGGFRVVDSAGTVLHDSNQLAKTRMRT